MKGPTEHLGGCAISYTIPFAGSDIFSMITVEATKYDENNLKPTSWAVRQRGLAMSNKTGIFCYEQLPSSRNDEYLEEFRFPTAEMAVACYENLILRKYSI
jgi:hypothetical protein